MRHSPSHALRCALYRPQAKPASMRSMHQPLVPSPQQVRSHTCCGGQRRCHAHGNACYLAGTAGAAAGGSGVAGWDDWRHKVWGANVRVQGCGIGRGDACSMGGNAMGPGGGWEA